MFFFIYRMAHCKAILYPCFQVQKSGPWCPFSSRAYNKVSNPLHRADNFYSMFGAAPIYFPLLDLSVSIEHFVEVLLAICGLKHVNFELLGKQYSNIRTSIWYSSPVAMSSEICTSSNKAHINPNKSNILVQSFKIYFQHDMVKGRANSHIEFMQAIFTRNC